MPRYFNSLRTRLNCLVLLAVLPGLGLTLYAYMKELQARKAYVREQAVLLTQVVSAHHQQLIAETRQLLVVLAQLPQIQDSYPTPCNALLKNLQQQYPRFATLGVVQRNGNVACSSSPNQSVNLADRVWIANALQKREFTVSDYQMGRISGKPVIVFAYPLFNAQNQANSVVFASLDLTWLNQLLAQINLPRNTSLLVVDAKGVVLAYHPHSEWVGERPNLPIVQKILAQGNGVAEVNDVDGISRLYAFTLLSSSLPQANVYMGIGLSEEAPFTVAERNLQRNLFGLAMIAMGAIAILWIGSDLFIWHWVRRFIQVINRLAAGDFTARIGLKDSPQEMQHLIDNFDRMAASLASQIARCNATEIELKKANERFQLATAAVHAIIYDWDIRAKTITRTQGLFDVLGYTTTEADPSDDWWLERIHPDEQKYVRNYIATMLKSSTSNDFALEYRIRKRDDRYVYVWDKGLIIRDADGGAVRVVGSVLDISERKQAEAAVNQMNATLEQQVQERTAQLAATNQELESFCYSVSHDLRAPLRHIAGFAEALAEQLKRNNAIADPKVHRYIEVIQSSSDRMTMLIDGLLTLSRVGRKQLIYQPVDLYPLVESAISLATSQAEAIDSRKIEFQIGSLPKVMGDPTLLQQVFTNLIDNAVKFSRHSHPTIIQIDSLPDQTLFIKDNGIGFQMEYADQLFGAFQRLHSQREFKGTGIGLAIVQRIIHRHRGTIWAESKPNQGTTFYFKLGQVVEE
ncbi:multi-sensor signal transduction histidine kinase [Gloeocapsa sp. PCC 7428]|uniref:ATP-binding protein n=1 Tax=Gloeocapsa sp. PCC 7428 TaxID=1173026 RepID=UPI0002A5D228|nr:ATP-binding protein [Gloeocapsa sp. PCC 7428]AFZ32581.1 multi-sensor signal transduction histidine kinase [Gloeocapsa sp. PCC 7428]